MVNCIICAEFDNCPWRSDPYVMCGGYRQKKMTNANRIRAMTDEELATLLTDVAKKSAEKLCESLKAVDVDLRNCDFAILYRAHLDWLREEATDEH